MFSMTVISLKNLTSAEPPDLENGVRNLYALSGERVDRHSTVFVMVNMSVKTVRGTVDNSSSMIHSLVCRLAAALLVTDSDTHVYFVM